MPSKPIFTIDEDMRKVQACLQTSKATYNMSKHVLPQQRIQNDPADSYYSFVWFLKDPDRQKDLHVLVIERVKDYFLLFSTTSCSAHAALLLIASHSLCVAGSEPRTQLLYLGSTSILRFSLKLQLIRQTIYTSPLQ